MNVVVFLLPLALALGGLGLFAFLWALKSGQFEDLEGAAWRVVMEPDGSGSLRDDTVQSPVPAVEILPER